MRPDVAHTRLICSMARHRVRRSAPRPPNDSANGSAEDVVLGEEAAHVIGPLGRPVDLRRAGRDAVVGELPDGVAKEDLLLREASRAVGGGAGAHAAILAAWGLAATVRRQSSGDDIRVSRA